MDCQHKWIAVFPTTEITAHLALRCTKCHLRTVACLRFPKLDAVGDYGAVTCKLTHSEPDQELSPSLLDTFVAGTH